MKRILRLLLIVGVLAGGLIVCSPSSEAGPFRRGGGYRGYGWGRAYGPAYGYRVYRPGFGGWGGYGMGYRAYGLGYGGYGMGYPAYGMGYPAYGMGMYPGYGYGMAYPSVYGTSVSVGGPLGGFSMSSYPY